MSINQSEIEHEKMKIKLEKKINLDSLSDIEKIQMDKYLNDEAVKRITSREVQNDIMDSLRG